MIVCVGEILADLICKQTQEGAMFGRYAGGAPFNVACGIAKLGGEAGFYGCVGEDLIGDFLVRCAEKQNFAYLRLDRLTDRNTTLAFVDLDENGERSFSFYRKHTADYCLDKRRIAEVLERANIVHLGSLPLSEERGRAFYDELICAARKRGVKVSFDVNYREDIFADREEAVRISKSYIAAADIVKLSADELLLLTGERDAEAGARLLDDGEKLIFVTFGKDGSACYHKGVFLRAYAHKVDKVVDTTGAGDAFYAGALSVVDREGYADLGKALRAGSICGTLTTTKKGAVDAFPDRESVRRLLEEDR